jgi:hypothetical protein
MWKVSCMICSSKMDFSTTAPTPAWQREATFSGVLVRPELATIKGFRSDNPANVVFNLLIIRVV